MNKLRLGEGNGKVAAGARAYLFSADAADYVRREKPIWQAWLQGLPVAGDAAQRL